MLVVVVVVVVFSWPGNIEEERDLWTPNTLLRTVLVVSCQPHSSTVRGTGGAAPTSFFPPPIVCTVSPPTVVDERIDGRHVLESRDEGVGGVGGGDVDVGDDFGDSDSLELGR